MSKNLLPVALNGLLASMFALATVIPAITHEAPQAGFVGMDQVDRSQVPSNIPAWTADVSKANPDCRPIGGNEIPASVLVEDRDGNFSRMTFQAAWDATHRTTKSHLFILGSCTN